MVDIEGQEASCASKQMCIGVLLVPNDTQAIGRNTNCQLLECHQQEKKNGAAITSNVTYFFLM